MRKDKRIKDSVKKFKEEFNPEDFLKDREYKKRRDTKRQRRYLIQRDRLIKVYRSMYLPTAICIFGGSVVTLFSTLRGIGENTFIWNYRHVFHYIGPIGLAVGIVLLLATEGLHGRRKKIVKEKIAREMSMRSNRSRTVSQRSSQSNSVCHSIDDLSEIFPAVDFKAQTLSVPSSSTKRAKTISQMSLCDKSKSTSCIFDRKNGLSQSVSSGFLKNAMTKILRNSKSLSFSHQEINELAGTTRRTNQDRDESGETVLNSPVGIRIVIQRPSTVGIEEEMNLLPKNMGCKKNGFQTRRIKRQDAFCECDEEQF